MSASGRPRQRFGERQVVLLLYPALALLTFPTLELLVHGVGARIYAHDLLDIPRSGVPGDWLAYGITLWNTHVAGGDPLLAQQAIGPFAIDVPLSMVVGQFGALVIDGWLLAAVAGVSMHLFLRDTLRLAPWAVVAGATLFTFSYWHPIIGFGVPLAPLLAWSLDRASRPSPTRWRYVLLHAIVGAFALYNGLSQVVLLGVAFELAWAALAMPAERRLRAVATTGFLWVVSFGLYAPVIATQLVALPLSQRTLWELAPVSLVDAVVGAAQRYASILVGLPVSPDVGISQSIYGTFYLGAVGLPLLALGVVRRRRERRWSLLVAFLVAIPLLDILFVGVTRPLQEQLGPLKSFQLDRVRHFMPFALASVSAIGADALVGAVRTPIRRPSVPRAAVVTVAGLGVLATGTTAVLALVRGGLSATRWEGSFLGAVAAAVGGVLLIALAIPFARARSGRIAAAARILARAVAPPARTAAGALVGTGAVAIVAVAVLGAFTAERVTYARAERLLGGDLASWRSSLGTTPAQRFLLAQPGIGLDRVLTFGDEANRMGAVGLLQADGYQAMYPRTYHDVFGALLEPWFAFDPTRRAYFETWGNRAMTFGPRVDPEIVDLLGVRWLYVRQPAGPANGASLSGDLARVPELPGLIERFRSSDVVVYENPNVLPRSFLVPAVVRLPDDAAVVSALRTASRNDLLTRAWVTGARDEARLASVPGVPAGAPASVGSSRVVSYTPDRVTVDLDASAPAVLVLTDTWAPGWEADVDGSAFPVARVDEAFRGVAVPLGRHRVTLRYAPGFTYLGFGVAGAIALIGVLSLAFVRRRDRRLAEGPAIVPPVSRPTRAGPS